MSCVLCRERRYYCPLGGSEKVDDHMCTIR